MTLLGYAFKYSIKTLLLLFIEKLIVTVITLKILHTLISMHPLEQFIHLFQKRKCKIKKLVYLLSKKLIINKDYGLSFEPNNSNAKCLDNNVFPQPEPPKNI